MEVSLVTTCFLVLMKFLPMYLGLRLLLLVLMLVPVATGRSVVVYAESCLLDPRT